MEIISRIYDCTFVSFEMLAVVPPSGGKETESKQYIGPVIGILSVVIIILVGAIIFIVIRNQRIKSSPGHCALPVTDKRNDTKVCIITFLITS